MTREEIPLTEQPVKPPEISGDCDETDGWVDGGRAPAQNKEELKFFLRCNHFCCSSVLAKRLRIAGCNRCWCCFDCCYSCCVGKRLVDHGKLYHERMIEAEEWMRGFSCWPLPILTITMCAIELYYFVSFSTSPDGYREELKNSTLMWHPSHRDEYHRWFTYSFLHGGFSHFFINFLMQIALGLFIEFEHKWVRMTIIYVVGVISGSLFHSVANPCIPLVGASGGIYALFGAGIIKLKRHKKYVGHKRKTFNLFLCIFILTLVVADLGNQIYFWVICDPTVQNTAISAHVGGLIGGLVTGFIVLNKFQESWGQQRMRETNEYQQTTDHDVRYANCCNFKEAYLCNPDVIKLLKQPLTYVLLAVLVGSWGYCIVMNERFTDDEIFRKYNCQNHCYYN